MDANRPETSMVEHKTSPSEVVLSITEDGGKDKDLGNGHHEAKDTQRLSVDSSSGFQKAVSVGCPSPDNSRFSDYSPSHNRPPKIPTFGTLVRRKSIANSAYGKPKSRFGEPSVPIDSKIFEEDIPVVQEPMESPSRRQSYSASPKLNEDGSAIPKDSTRNVPMTPRTPMRASSFSDAGVDEDEEIYKKVSSRNKLKNRKVKYKVLVEWFVCFCLMGCFILSLTVHKLKHWLIWGLELWEWCLMIMVTFSGMLLTRWFILVIVLLIELNFILKKKVIYFVHGLKKSVQLCLWLSLVLLTWVFMFNGGVNRSKKTDRILDYITRTLIAMLIGACLWLLKNLLLKMLASSFHVNTFFDRIQEAIFHQYILRTLSGPPVMESAQKLERTNSTTSQLNFRRTKKGKDGKEKKEKGVIDISKLHQMKQEKVSAWTMKMLVDAVSNSGLSTISSKLDESFYDGGNEQTDKEITNEEEAIAAAYHIFRNVAQPGCRYIDEYDLERFMIKEEVYLVFPMIDVCETGHIDRKALTDWVVKVYNGRKALAHALNDTKTAVKQLNKLVSIILYILVIIIWLLLMGIATTQVLVFLSSQLVVAAFIFGNTCKTIFEAIIFVFVMHPFDVGDRCVVGGVQMIVEEMNILTTVFLRYDNEKIYYPNSVLATKPISNFYRSPDMGDSVEFSIDFRTPMEKIGALKDKIMKYLEKNSQHWHPNHSVVVKEIENVNKIKMALYMNHTMNFQDMGEKNRRRTILVLEMKKFFEELGIRYDLLPQEVHLVDPKRSAGWSRDLEMT
ncbi:ion channel [Lithospermum erythrorhizon]|uniref:Mechanosensitive ion channel protein n=1 Tax=Lithospermum erythrorhizon TaxID=34254 RepID=A0AAV3QDX7_LITER